MLFGIFAEVILSFVLLSGPTWAAVSFDTASYNAQNIIRKDVVVVGGGSSGVYTAVRLKDYGKSVTIIEKNNYIGGHAETYVDPQSGVPINLGVVVFPHTKTATDYFGRFNVSLEPLSVSSSGGNKYIDFSTGATVKFTPPAAADVGIAFKAYAAQLAKYPALQGGFDLTYPVASDLLLPFGKFVDKYNLTSLLYTLFSVNQGYAPLLDLSTVYMLKYLNANELRSLGSSFLTTTSHNTGELYDKILTQLGSDVLLNTEIVALDRSSSSEVRIVTRSTGAGIPKFKLIIAKKLVSTPPPKVEQLTGYDLDSTEVGLFSQFFDNGYYGGVINNTGLNPDISYNAVDPNQPNSIPKLPGLYAVNPTGASKLVQVFYGSPTPLPVEQVKADILDKVKRLAVAQGVTPAPSPDFVAFTNHAPFNLMVSTQAIQSGFYQKLYGLQGRRNTFWNGAAWQAQDSGSIWEFTDSHVLPKVLASLA